MRRAGERGGGLILAMFLLLLASSLGAVLLDRSRAVRGATAHDAVDLRALHAAEAGVAQARHELARDPDFRGRRLRVGDLEVELSVDRDERGWNVVSLARPGGCRIEARLAAGATLPRVERWQRR